MNPQDDQTNAHEWPNKQSPKTLDDKILAYSREHAPKRIRSNPGWMQAAAIASVCIVTVLIVIPEDTRQTPFPASVHEELTAERADAAPSKAPEARVRQTIASASPMLAQPLKPKQDKDKLPKSAAGLSTQIRQKSAVQLSDDAHSNNTFIKKSMQAKRQQKEMAPAKAEGLSTPSAFQRPDAVIKQLENIQQLADAGKRQAALSAYELLRQQCSNCALPKRMDDALADLKASKKTKE